MSSTGLRVLQRKLYRNLRDYGASAAVVKALKGLVSPLYSRTVYRIYVHSLEDATHNAVASHGIRFSLLESADADDGVVMQIEGMEEWLAGSLRARLAAGAVCLVAFDGPTVAGFNLVATRGDVWIPLVHSTRVLKPGEAWSEQITVHRDYRRCGLGTFLRSQLFYELHTRGVKVLYGGTLASNHISRSFAHSLGFREIEEIRYMRVVGIPSWSTRQLE